MTHWHNRAAFLLCTALLLNACSALGTATTAPPPVQSTGGATTPSESTQTAKVGNAVTLNIWLPPQFDPAGGSLAAGILQTRLSEFAEQHPQVQIIARVKAEEGAGGMLDSLMAAQQAAPLALPDLALLPAGLLPFAAQNEILRPLGPLSEALNSDDWYPFARQMVTWQGQDYGLPFAGDALVLAYRSTAVPESPPSWQKLLAGHRALGFAAADPQALFTLAQLVSLQSVHEGIAEFTVADEDLMTLFEFLADGQVKEVFPYWLAQFQNDGQTWQAFTEGRLPMTAAWTSQVFASRQSEIVGAPLPTQSGQPFTAVKGWAWGVTAVSAERADLAAELAEFLTTPEFLAQYSAAAGLLPPRSTSLAAWAPDDHQALASQIVTNAVAFPDQTTLERWGKALGPAVVAILKQEATPDQALQSVRAALANSQ